MSETQIKAVNDTVEKLNALAWECCDDERAKAADLLAALLAECETLREALHNIAWPGQRRPVVPDGEVHAIAIEWARAALALQTEG